MTLPVDFFCLLDPFGSLPPFIGGVETIPTYIQPDPNKPDTYLFTTTLVKQDPSPNTTFTIKPDSTFSNLNQ